MKELLDYILSSIIQENYTVEEKEDNGKLILEIKIPKEKMGLVIGKGGRIIKAIQDIVRIKARLENKIVFINVSEKN